MVIFILILGRLIQCVFVVLTHTVICSELPIDVIRMLESYGTVEIVFEIPLIIKIFNRRRKK